MNNQENNTMRVIKVRHSGNLLVKFMKEIYWITPNGDVLNTTTQEDHDKKVKMMENGSPDFSYVDIDPIALNLGKKVMDYKKKGLLIQKTHTQNPFAGLKKMVKEKV